MQKLLKVMVLYEQLGGHVHMGVWSNMVPSEPGEYTLAKCGDLVMSEDEFKIFREALSRDAFSGHQSSLLASFEFVPRRRNGSR